MPLLEIRNLTVTFATAAGPFKAVGGIDLDVDTGEVVVSTLGERAGGRGADRAADHGHGRVVVGQLGEGIAQPVGQGGGAGYHADQAQIQQPVPVGGLELFQVRDLVGQLGVAGAQREAITRAAWAVLRAAREQARDDAKPREVARLDRSIHEEKAILRKLERRR